ncbi:MAG: L-glyceraldehyde 3-phosphate reductase [Prolixibacteraceae bacterium]|jgi:L-glyceraldehyde 3-phosphate reductase|nr:L-glyceraldehyde 3-phosphate reductase [Prolixibacteraceae bacterium]
MDIYQPNSKRYDKIAYNRCGKSGLKLPSISLGLWHNFGGVDTFGNGREVIRAAFDNGITHIDLANNYGPPPGSAEETFGRILKKDFSSLRDELVISTKAGYEMWEGPYGDFGSRKYLVSSLDQSLKRMGLDYVDIFYHHRPDPETPLEETMSALDHIVRQGKALYVGISNYSAEETEAAAKILKKLGTPCLINQVKYSMFERWVEDQLLDTAEDNGIGLIAFSPLAQGLLTDKYLTGIPANSRAAKSWGFLHANAVEQAIDKVTQLNSIAIARGQSLAQMAIAWLLKDKRITSVLVGASSVEQLEDNIGALDYTLFSTEEIDKIEAILLK